jgi:hypothetical protein
MSSRKSWLARTLAKPYWREADAKVVLQAWARSGQPLVAFAHAHSIPIAKLRRWKTRLGEVPAAVVFHRVRVRPGGDRKPAQPAGPGVELVVAGGRRILVQRGFDEELLHELVQAVECWSC